MARTLGKILFAYGLLAKPDVIETSAADLIGAYVGHSRKNVEEKMKAARGGVLFIDEAYGLGKGAAFTDEAVDQLVGMLTLPEYVGGKTVVILAGYTDEMHRMLTHNVGLKSRFTETIEFDDWTPTRCAELVVKSLRSGTVPFTLHDVDHSTAVLGRTFTELQRRPGWGNARDAVQLASKIADARDNRVARLPDDAAPDAIIERLDVEARPKQTADKPRADPEAVAVAFADALAPRFKAALLHRSPLQAPFIQSRLLGVAIRTDTFALQPLAWPQMRTQPFVSPTKAQVANAVVWPLRCATLATSTIAMRRCTEARRLRRSTRCRLCHCCSHRRTMLSNSPSVRGR